MVGVFVIFMILAGIFAIAAIFFVAGGIEEGKKRKPGNMIACYVLAIVSIACMLGVLSAWAFPYIPARSMMINDNSHIGPTSQRILRVFGHGGRVSVCSLPYAEGENGSAGTYSIVSWDRDATTVMISGMTDAKFRNRWARIIVEYSGTPTALVATLDFGGEEAIQKTIVRRVREYSTNHSIPRTNDKSVQKEIAKEIESAFDKKMRVKVTFIEIGSR